VNVICHQGKRPHYPSNGRLWEHKSQFDFGEGKNLLLVLRSESYSVIPIAEVNFAFGGGGGGGGGWFFKRVVAVLFLGVQN
jgi:hypothetical protein